MKHKTLIVVFAMLAVALSVAYAASRQRANIFVKIAHPLAGYADQIPSDDYVADTAVMDLGETPSSLLDDPAK
jgi:hypothetical protein